MSTETKAVRPEPKSDAERDAIFARYEVRGVKGFDGMDGYAFNATIYRDGKKFLVVEQSGRGGCNMYHSATRGKPGEWRERVETLRADALAWYVGSNREADFAQSIGKDVDDVDPRSEVEDTLVAVLMDAHEERQWLMTATRGARKVLFQVDGDIHGPSWRQYLKLDPAKTPKAVEAAKKQGDRVRVVWREGKALKDEVFGK